VRMLKPRIASVALTAGLVASTVAGCGTAQEGAQPTTPATTSVTPSVSATPTPTPTPTATPSPTPTRTAPPPPPMAADGTKYEECADGTCEVAIPKPVRIELSDGNVLRITKVNADGIDIDLSLAAGGGGNGTLKGTCGVIFQFAPGGGGSGRFCPADGSSNPSPEPIAGMVQLQMVGRNAQGAVLRVVSG
jgi:hypothetical protein